jgi:hypothetical protein
VEDSPKAPQPLLAGPRERLGNERVGVEGHPAFEALAERALGEGKPRHWVVVDDLYEDSCELAISPWPRLTESGRLVFTDGEEEHQVGEISRQDLFELVQKARRAHFPDATEAVVSRPLRFGDTFAAVVDVVDVEVEAPVGGHRTEVRFPWEEQAIVDVTPDARVFAKVQVAVAEAPPITADEFADIAHGLSGGKPGPEQEA